jgi:hypothetical protein
MTSIDALQKVWADPSSPTPAATPVAPPQMAPVARLLWLKQVLAELGLSSDFLADADRLAARATALKSSGMMAQQEAAARPTAALNRLATDEAVSLAEAAAKWVAASAWLDVREGQTRPLALELGAGRRVRLRPGLPFRFLVTGNGCSRLCSVERSRLSARWSRCR